MAVKHKQDTDFAPPNVGMVTQIPTPPPFPAPLLKSTSNATVLEHFYSIKYGVVKKIGYPLSTHFDVKNSVSTLKTSLKGLTSL